MPVACYRERANGSFVADEETPLRQTAQQKAIADPARGP